MSSAKDIVQSLSALVISVDELLQTETAMAAPDIAKELGAESQLNSAIDFLAGLLDKIKGFLQPLRDPLLHISALAGVMGLMGPFIDAISQLTQLSGEQMAETGLGEVVQITSGITEVVEIGGELLDGGQAVLNDLPSITDLDALLASFSDLNLTLLSRKAEVA